MPIPMKDETKDEFISRCIFYVKKEKPDMPQNQIVAYCFSIWEEESAEALVRRIKEYLDAKDVPGAVRK